LRKKMKQQRLKQVTEEELQKLLNEQDAQMRSLAGVHASMRQDRARNAEQKRMAAELGLTDEVPVKKPRSKDRVGRQIRVQSTPGTDAETRITSPGSSTISRGAVTPPAISPDSELAAMNPSLVVPSQTFTQEEPMTFNVRRGKNPKEVTYQPKSVRVSGRRKPKPGQEHESSWYETYFGEPQSELMGNIIGGIGDYARKGYEALGLPQWGLQDWEKESKKQIVRAAKGTGDWLANQSKYGRDAPSSDVYYEDTPEGLRKKMHGLTTTGEYRLGLGAEGWEQVTNVLDAVSMIIPGGLVKKALRPEDIIKIGDDIVMGKVDDSLYKAMEGALKRKKMPATKQDVYEGIVNWLDNPYNAVGSDDMSRATFKYAKSIDPDEYTPLLASGDEASGQTAAGLWPAQTKVDVEGARSIYNKSGGYVLDAGDKPVKVKPSKKGADYPTGHGRGDLGDIRVPTAEEGLGTYGTTGRRMGDVLEDVEFGHSGHLGVDDYFREFNQLDLAGDNYLANPYFMQNADNAARIAKKQAPLPLDPTKALDQTMNRHQFLRLKGEGGKPDIILNRIITRGADGKDVVTHSGWMTPNAYNHQRMQGMLAGHGRKGKMPGLALEDMATLGADGQIISGRAGGKQVVRGKQSYPAAAGGGVRHETLQERKRFRMRKRRYFKLRIKR
jgi:hypothetical protein